MPSQLLHRCLDITPNKEFFIDYFNESIENSGFQEDIELQDTDWKTISSYSFVLTGFLIENYDMDNLYHEFCMVFKENCYGIFRECVDFEDMEERVCQEIDEFKEKYVELWRKVIKEEYLDILRDLNKFEKAELYSTYSRETLCSIEPDILNYIVNVDCEMTINIYEEDVDEINNKAKDIISNFVYEKSYNPHNKFGRHMISWRAEEEGIIPSEEEENAVEQHNIGECECKDCKRIQEEIEALDFKEE